MRLINGEEINAGSKETDQEKAQDPGDLGGDGRLILHEEEEAYHPNDEGEAGYCADNANQRAGEMCQNPPRVRRVRRRFEREDDKEATKNQHGPRGEAEPSLRVPGTEKPGQSFFAR